MLRRPSAVSFIFWVRRDHVSVTALQCSSDVYRRTAGPAKRALRHSAFRPLANRPVWVRCPRLPFGSAISQPLRRYHCAFFVATLTCPASLGGRVHRGEQSPRRLGDRPAHATSLVLAPPLQAHFAERPVPVHLPGVEACPRPISPRVRWGFFRAHPPCATTLR
jgi:hypothetical protein